MQRKLIGILAMFAGVIVWFILILIRWETYVVVTFPEPRGEAIWAYDPLGFGAISLLCGLLFLYGLFKTCEIGQGPTRVQGIE